MAPPSTSRSSVGSVAVGYVAQSRGPLVDASQPSPRRCAASSGASLRGLTTYSITQLTLLQRLDECEGRKLTPIRGLPPDLINLPQVCPFSPRCDYFVAGKCDQTVPPLRPVGPDHRAACLFDITLDTPIPSRDHELAEVA